MEERTKPADEGTNVSTGSTQLLSWANTTRRHQIMSFRASLRLQAQLLGVLLRESLPPWDFPLKVKHPP